MKTRPNGSAPRPARHLAGQPIGRTFDRSYLENYASERKVPGDKFAQNSSENTTYLFSFQLYVTLTFRLRFFKPHMTDVQLCDFFLTARSRTVIIRVAREVRRSPELENCRRASLRVRGECSSGLTIAPRFPAIGATGRARRCVHAPGYVRFTFRVCGCRIEIRVAQYRRTCFTHTEGRAKGSRGNGKREALG